MHRSLVQRKVRGVAATLRVPQPLPMARSTHNSVEATTQDRATCAHVSEPDERAAVQAITCAAASQTRLVVTVVISSISRKTN